MTSKYELRLQGRTHTTVSTRHRLLAPAPFPAFISVLYSILCCLCLPCRKKTRDLGQKSKKARSTDVYDYRNVDMEKVYGRLKKRRVSQVPSVFEIFPCQWTPESASHIRNGDNSVDCTLKGGYAEVKWWQTFNEPASFVAGYSGNTAIAPAINSSGVGDYMAAYTLLKAHAAAYRLYDEQYRATQQGKVGITINVMWYEPATDAQADIDAAERKNQFYAGLYGHPIFTSEGDYPAVVKQRVAENSQAGGYPRSRLIEFTPEEVEYIKGTADFFGLNHYTSYPTTEGVSGSNPSMDLDAGAVAGDYTDYPLAASSWLRSVPWGFRKTLNWLVQQYPGYPIFVMENGWSDTGELDDQGRIDYYGAYLAEMLNAMNEDGVPVIGYTAWSLLDNFEWGTGFTTRFGLHYVDITDPDRKRTPKASSRFLEEIFRTKTLPAKYMI
ncbi:myrosinase 1-like [Schistocerca nitens]|uniref:myrosinase 1-like n=1 Tax=Schistocerca nitens TaxID=7011 RepID=UPI002118D311|nr:myrosinase 1-like [Schistocerca nitens]